MVNQTMSKKSSVGEKASTTKPTMHKKNVWVKKHDAPATVAPAIDPRCHAEPTNTSTTHTKKPKESNGSPDDRRQLGETKVDIKVQAKPRTKRGGRNRRSKNKETNRPENSSTMDNSNSNSSNDSKDDSSATPASEKPTQSKRRVYRPVQKPSPAHQTQDVLKTADNHHNHSHKDDAARSPSSHATTTKPVHSPNPASASPSHAVQSKPAAASKDNQHSEHSEARSTGTSASQTYSEYSGEEDGETYIEYDKPYPSYPLFDPTMAQYYAQQPVPVFMYPYMNGSYNQSAPHEYNTNMHRSQYPLYQHMPYYVQHPFMYPYAATGPHFNPYDQFYQNATHPTHEYDDRE